MSNHEQEGLNRLHADVIEDGLPSPELLARYASDPNGLEPAERRIIEEAMERSPIVVDELDTLRHFDFAALDADRAEAGAAEGLVARILGALRHRPQIAAAAVIAVVILIWMGRPAELDPTDPPQTNVAEQPAPGAAEESTRLADTSKRAAESNPPTAPDAERPTSRIAFEETPSPREATTHTPRSPSPLPTPPPAVEPIEPAEPAEILVAMAMPEYRPAYGLEVPGIEDWTTRSDAPSALRIRLAAPQHVTRSSTPQPVLHWSIDRIPPTGSLLLTIVGRDDEPIVLDRVVPRPAEAGLQRLDLAALQIALPGDRVLRWSIALRENEDTPPSAFDFGWLRVAPLDPLLATGIAASATPDQVARYAEAGCFHEALEAALETLDRHPADPRARQAVDRLLEQAGLEAQGDALAP